MASLPANRLVENHYGTMSMESIKALLVQNIAKDRSILFLWTTSPKNEEGLAAMKSWGFTYRTQIIWEKYSNGKFQIGLGNNVREPHELLLIGKRGDFPGPKYKPPATITTRRTEHSAKPDKFYEIIEAMYPEASRIELFARYTRPGWASVGNQIETVSKLQGVQSP
ncbi:MAG: MT-A70 family methyltransferase [Thermoplasmatales archaeon]